MSPAVLFQFGDHSVERKRAMSFTTSKNIFLAHADRGRAQDDVGLMGETDLRSSGEKGTVN